MYNAILPLGGVAAPRRSTSSKVRGVLVHMPWYTLTMMVVYLICYWRITLESDVFYELALDMDETKQAYRWYTYSLLHASPMHIGSNIVVYAFTSIPVECDNFIWRTVLIHLFSILGGAFGPGWEHRLLPPSHTRASIIVGASGGIYGMFSSMSGNLILNWPELSENKRIAYTTSLCCMVTADVIANSAWPDPSISYSCHIGGFVAGIFSGICFMKNTRVLKWENRLKIASGVILGAYTVAGAVNLAML